MSDEKLFTWQNINTFVRGIIEPHVQALRKRHDSYVHFNDKRHEEFKNDINTRFNQFKQWTETELANLRTWTQSEIKYLKDTLIDEETGKLKYDVIPVNQLVEVGTIMTWPVDTMMVDKYLYCDGRKIPDGREYYDLKNVLKSDYVPDYRGLFLRGYGSHKSTHYVSDEDTEQGYTLHQSGEFGIPQGDAIREIEGEFGTPDEVYAWAKGVFKLGTYNYAGSMSYSGGISFIFQASRVTPVSNEIRPINLPVKYFIRAIG